jgi:endonuclease/exonuclease/phosphatase family metal-dependent hydrolase
MHAAALLSLLMLLAAQPPVASAPAAQPTPPVDAPDQSPERVSVATFNIWVGGEKADPDKAVSRAQTLAAMKALDVDVLAIQERRGFAEEYAAGLGYAVVPLGDSTAVLTRLEVIGVSPSKWGAKLRTRRGTIVWAFNVHLPASPYQPYQLASIEYNDGRFISTPSQAVTEARLARGGPALACLRDVDTAMRETESLVILCGDFNEPSHLDWTSPTVAAWNRTGPVDWPTTRLFHDAGLRDAFRVVHPDPVAKPGWTWTPRPDTRDVMDRIDLVLAAPIATNDPSPHTSNASRSGDPWQVVKAEIAGEAGPMTDRVIEPWPSDHRAVRVVFENRRAGHDRQDRTP